MENVNLQLSPEENEKLYKLYSQADLSRKNITIYGNELTENELVLDLENHLTNDIQQINVPIEILTAAIEDGEYNKTGYTKYNSDHIEGDYPFFTNPLKWWEKDATPTEQQNILKRILRRLMSDSLKLGRGEAA